MQNRVVVGALLGVLLGSASAQAALLKPRYEFRLPPAIPPDPGQTFGVDNNGISPPVFNVGQQIIGFEGISQYDVASVQRNFIPPDTIGAAGRTQFMQFVNGGVAVYDKATGNRTSFVSDVAWWAGHGVTGASGDSRILFNKQANRWIVLSFAANTKDIQIAVSNNSDALGSWKTTTFEGFAELIPGGRTLADFPTLAMDNNAVYIGTNDFAVGTPGGPTSFRGTTLNVIPLASLFNNVAPTTTGKVSFVTPYDAANPASDFSRGFAIQGVNSTESTDGTGHIVAASINDFGLTRYDVLNAGTAAAVRTATTSTLIGTTYTFNDPARQPAVAVPANQRIVDSFGDQIGSSAFEANGRIYSVHTVTDINSAFTSVRYTVLDTATDTVLFEGSLADGTHDFYQGALAVNGNGQVVLTYNRSGLDPADGKITLAARTFNTDAAGQLVATSGEIVLRISDTDDYHNGALFGQPGAGRQRWADYASVTLDPVEWGAFWVTGTFAREYNLPEFGHPGGTGGSRWGTYITRIDVGGVPEPATWAMMIGGFGLVGGSLRRRRTGFATA